VEEEGVYDGARVAAIFFRRRHFSPCLPWLVLAVTLGLLDGRCAYRRLPCGTLLLRHAIFLRIHSSTTPAQSAPHLCAHPKLHGKSNTAASIPPTCLA